MATFVLVNSTQVGLTQYYAGEVFSDVFQPTAAISAAGGTLVATGNATIDAAAARCTALLKNRGASTQTVDAIMFAAMSAGPFANASSTTAGLMSIADKNLLLAFAGARQVRGVCYANQSTAAFVGVSGGTPQDGVTYVAGDRVLLAAQSTPAQNGIYVVGTATAGTAPLTRALDLPTGATVVNGMTVEVSEGTIFAGSTWKAMCTGANVIGTNDPVFYPRVCKGRFALSSGTYTLGSVDGLFLFSTTTSQFFTQFDDQSGTLTTTTGYKVSASAGRTAGVAGTAAATIIAHVAAGTIQNLDNSTLDWMCVNW